MNIVLPSFLWNITVGKLLSIQEESNHPKNLVAKIEM